jgi:glycosyltransferase involved in cell wall biosynthesis
MSYSSQPPDTFDPPRNPLRVTHLVKGLGPGGAERLIVNQLLTSSSDIEYTVARILKGKHHLVQEIEATGARTVVVPGGRFWPLGLRSLLRSTRPDIVHAHSPVMAGVVRLLRATGQVGSKLITTEHNRWPRHHPLTRELNKRTARFDDVRIAVSHDVRDSMSPQLQDSTTVIDHGVPVDTISVLRDHRDEMRARLLGERAPELTVIGIVANFRPEKAYEVFLEAAEISAAERTNVRFVVVGQGPGEAAFRDSVSRSEHSDVIEVLGFRDDATMVMAAFDIFTLSSRHEGKPVSLMEAFALGIPAVCTRAGGIPEAVVDGENGLLVDIDDAQGLASAWIELVDDPVRRDLMAQAARNSSSRFDAATSTRSIESRYRDSVA